MCDSWGTFDAADNNKLGDWLGLFAVSCSDIEKENLSVGALNLQPTLCIDAVDRAPIIM
jgi:hypothetical protein